VDFFLGGGGASILRCDALSLLFLFPALRTTKVFKNCFHQSTLGDEGGTRLLNVRKH
jgi:hypothetical protein